MLANNIILSGTGGQGIIIASRIIAQVAFKSGFDVKESELHGMAQRGGSVIGHVRFGDVVYSPYIPAGMADIMIALEELEALRYIYFLKPGGVVILNRKRILPATFQEKDYPENVEILIKKAGINVKSIDAQSVAKQIGNPKVENSVILGFLSTFLPFSEQTWIEVITESVPHKTIELNLKAFNEGRRLATEDAILEQTIRNSTKG